MRIVRAATENVQKWVAEVRARQEGSDLAAREAAETIVADVRARGDVAAAEQVLRFDKVTIAPGDLLVRPAATEIDADLAVAIDVAVRRVTAYHTPQRVSGYRIADGDSVLTQEIVPLRRVGIYVPGGAATYISTLIMCAIPAKLAGVRELVVVTTPRAAASPELNYVCNLLGVTAIYRAGGAAGIAALAFGTESLERVDKIVGPGNAYVAAAKQAVAGRVGLDLIAGPSEIIVLADDTADPELIAADLLAQSEHGADSSAICITTSAALAQRVSDAVDARLAGGTAQASIESNGAIVVARDAAESFALVDALAPEHLEIMLDDPEPALAAIENCSAIYVGGASGVALGDYVVGTNHVLPTAGSARFSSALGVYDFVKRRNVVRLGAATAAAIGLAARTLATTEGLPLHAESAAARCRAAAEEGVTR